MGKNSLFLIPFASFCIISAVAFSTEQENKPNTQQKIELSIINNSHKNLCIQDGNGEQCSDETSIAWQITPQYFYERDGVIRLSLNHEPPKIAMFKKGISSASLRIDENGNLSTERNTFEKGSFVYSDNSDYLYFAAKPFNLFGENPA